MSNRKLSPTGLLLVLIFLLFINFHNVLSINVCVFFIIIISILVSATLTRGVEGISAFFLFLLMNAYIVYGKLLAVQYFHIQVIISFLVIACFGPMCLKKSGNKAFPELVTGLSRKDITRVCKSLLSNGLVEVKQILLIPFLVFGPLLFTKTSHTFASLLLGYDHVVHLGVLRKLASCQQAIKLCSEPEGSPLDQYPALGHSFYASVISGHVFLKEEWVTIYVGTLLSIAIISYALIASCVRLFNSDCGSTGGRQFQTLALFAPFLIGIYAGYPFYAFAIVILMYGIANIVTGKSALALLSLSVAGHMYPVFWPLSGIFGIFLLIRNMTLRSSAVYFLLVAIPGSAYFLSSISNGLVNYLLVESKINLISIFLVTILLPISKILISLSMNESDRLLGKILFLFSATCLLIVLFYLIVDKEGNYWIEKFFYVATFLIIIGASRVIILNTRFKPNRILYFTVLSVLIFTLAIWSIPNFISKYEYRISQNSILQLFKSKTEYGLYASPLTSWVRTVAITIGKPKEFAEPQIARSETILLALSGTFDNKEYLDPPGPYQYHNTQWVNALNGTWGNSIQNTIDQINDAP